jgi:hypothetical protein
MWETEVENMEWSYLAHDGYQLRVTVNTLVAFLDQLTNGELLKNSASWCKLVIKVRNCRLTRPSYCSV